MIFFVIKSILSIVRIWPSGYENGVTGFCILVKSRVLASISIKIGEMIFRTFVSFFELFGEVFPQLFPNWFDTYVRSFL